MTFDEVADAAELVKSVVDASANIIFGARIDPNVQDEVEITVIATGFPGYDNRREEEQKRAYNNGALYDNGNYGNVYNRMSVNQPYYPPRQSVEPQPYQRPVQPIQPVQPVQQPVRQQYIPPRSAEPEREIERPIDKSLPKFVEKLRNIGKKNND